MSSDIFSRLHSSLSSSYSARSITSFSSLFAYFSTVYAPPKPHKAWAIVFFDGIKFYYRTERPVVTDERDVPFDHIRKNKITADGETYYLMITMAVLKRQEI